MLTETYAGIGSNLGDRVGYLAAAARGLSALGVGFRMSSVYETTPIGFDLQPNFYNTVCRFWTRLGPFELLAAVMRIESERGRRRTFVNAPRELDIDILTFGDSVLRTPKLTLPHPRMEQREFVLIPLAELSPRFRHPESGETPAETLRRLDGSRTGKGGLVTRLPGLLAQ